MTPRSSATLERYVFDLSMTDWTEMPTCDVANAVVFAARGSLNQYPDQSARQARRLLAERHGLRAEQFVLGNGAGDLLQTAALALLSPEDELLTPWPSYPLYPLMARRAGARPVPVALDGFGAVDVEALLAATTERTRIVCICNPNDPTGTYLESEALVELLSQLPERVHVFLDEALIHFQTRESEDASLRLVEEFSSLLVFRSFSSAYGLSGVRAGYAVGSRDATGLLEALTPALGVNSMTQAAVEAAVQRCDRELARRRERVAEQRQRVTDELARLGVRAAPSEANFVWLRVDGKTSIELATAFQRAGVIVFTGSGLGDPEHVRVSLKDTAATERFLTVLAEIVAQPVYGDLVEVAA